MRAEDDFLVGVITELAALSAGEGTRKKKQECADRQIQITRDKKDGQIRNVLYRLSTEPIKLLQEDIGVDRIFDRMGSAETIIEEYMLVIEKNVKVRVWDCFRLLRPVYREMSHQLYVNHVREIVKRVVDGSPTEPATDSELVFILSNVSLEVPLNDVMGYIYTNLFLSVEVEIEAAFRKKLCEYVNRHIEDFCYCYDEDLLALRLQFSQGWRH